jgi:hypothetical protein
MAFNMANVSGGNLFIGEVSTKDFRKKEGFLISFSSTASYTALFSCAAFSGMDFFIKGKAFRVF